MNVELLLVIEQPVVLNVIRLGKVISILAFVAGRLLEGVKFIV